MIPKKINITTDNTVLEFVETQVKDSKGVKLQEPLHIYVYTKSLTKKGDKLALREKDIVGLIDNQKLFA